MSNLIDSVRSYILTCPFLSDGRVMHPAHESRDSKADGSTD